MTDKITSSRMISIPEKIPSITGVTWVPKQGWRATLYRDGQKYHLGHYWIRRDAEKAMEEARKKPDLERINNRMSKEELDQKLAEFIKEHGRRPKGTEFRKYRISIAKFYRTFSNMLFENGIDIKVTKGSPKYSDELLFKEVWALREKLGRIPQQQEFPYKYIYERFGTWRRFLLAAGLIDDLEDVMHYKLGSKYIEEKTQELVEYLIETGEDPTYTVARKAKFHPQWFIEQYGSWSNFKEEILLPRLEKEKEYQIKRQLMKAKKPKTTYLKTTQEERHKIVLDCLAHDKDYDAMAIKYRVSKFTVYNWVEKYEQLGLEGLQERRGRRKKDQPKD